ncbi:MAG: tetratricopeptide repeat protein [Thermoflavifilum sp.]|nr:tetratricopeptide repeat protein [Thermoflavifilum sp.]
MLRFVGMQKEKMSSYRVDLCSCLIGLMALLAMSCHHQEPTYTAEQQAILHEGLVGKITDSIRSFPGNADLYAHRSQELARMQQYRLADMDIRKALQMRPQEAQYYFQLGELYFQQDSLEQARKYMRRAVELKSESLVYQMEYANVLYHAKAYTEALKVLSNLRRQYPPVAEIYGLESRVYQGMGDTAAAIASMQEAVKRSPDNYEALMAMGDLLAATRNPACLKWYREAERVDTTAAEPIYAQAAYYAQMHQPQQAIKLLNHCINTDAFYTDAYLLLANIYLQQHAFSRGLTILNLAQRMAPANDRVYFLRGSCWEKMGDTARAVLDYRRSLVFNKQADDARQALERLGMHP